jgi:uncharacterized membrane protein
MADNTGWQIGRKIAPPRFLIFMALAVIGAAIAIPALGWRQGGMVAFDVATIEFLVSIYPLLCSKPEQMREASKRNDANRPLLLGISAIVSTAILVAIASELAQHGATKHGAVALIIGTLALAWIFSNMIYTLHYAHMYYGDADGDGKDAGGMSFPETPEPDYWDFIYFAFCLGMTFQTSDVNISSRQIRKAVTAHCLAAFIFNIGIIAFSINVLGGG